LLLDLLLMISRDRSRSNGLSLFWRTDPLLQTFLFASFASRINATFDALAASVNKTSTAITVASLCFRLADASNPT
jgi:hypothetical protein